MFWFVAACSQDGLGSYREVRQVIDEHCVECHQPEGVAPVPDLSSDEKVRGWAASIKLMVEDRQMPPSALDASGFCREFTNVPVLSRAEISTISAWATRGGPVAAGTRQAPRQRSQRAERFVPSGVVLDPGVPFAPNLLQEGTRCYVVDPELVSERWLSAIQINSKSARSVQRVTLFSLDSEPALAWASHLEERDPRIGFPCYGAPRQPSVRFLARWTWGTSVLRLPGAVSLLPQRKLLMQVHYNVIPTGLDIPAPLRVALELDQQAQRAEVRVLRLEALNLPPARTYTEVKGSVRFEAATSLLGVAAEMHSAGKALQLRLLPSKSCVASFDHWNLYRQQSATFRHPLALAAGDELWITCAYNTQGRDQPTHAGEAIDQEDCAVFLYLGVIAQ
jgi:Copper type II ascorbate-dependent monooxygenase, C-terminal domain